MDDIFLANNIAFWYLVLPYKVGVKYVIPWSTQNKRSLLQNLDDLGNISNIINKLESPIPMGK